MEMFSRKEKIMDAAVKLFSEKGYDNVSMRDIAGTVGINVASAYNLFPSKKDILKDLYEFYALQKRLAAPSMETIMSLIETEPVHTILMRLDFQYPPPLQDIMNRILIIASQRIGTDPDGKRFFREIIFESTASLILPLLKKLIELGKIEPIDVETFTCLLTYYCYSSVMLNYTSIQNSIDKWRSGLEMIFTLLKTIPN